MMNQHDQSKEKAEDTTTITPATVTLKAGRFEITRASDPKRVLSDKTTEKPRSRAQKKDHEQKSETEYYSDNESSSNEDTSSNSSSDEAGLHEHSVGQTDEDTAMSMSSLSAKSPGEEGAKRKKKNNTSKRQRRRRSSKGNRK